MAVIDTTRGYRHWEEEMLGEYLGKFHAGCRVITRVRLGPLEAQRTDPTLTPEELRMLGTSFRRWADAACLEGGTLYIIEAAMIPDPRDISLLLTYLHLVDVTPELQDLATLPRKGLLVWGVDDPYSRTIATNVGIEVRVFRPSNWAEWLTVKRAREQRPARTGIKAG